MKQTRIPIEPRWECLNCELSCRGRRDYVWSGDGTGASPIPRRRPAVGSGREVREAKGKLDGPRGRNKKAQQKGATRGQISLGLEDMCCVYEVSPGAGVPSDGSPRRPRQLSALEANKRTNHLIVPPQNTKHGLPTAADWERRAPRPAFFSPPGSPSGSSPPAS